MQRERQKDIRRRRQYYLNSVKPFPREWGDGSPTGKPKKTSRRTNDDVLNFALDQYNDETAPNFVGLLRHAKYLPHVYVCVPTHASTNLPGLFESLSMQDYPNYSVVLSYEEGDTSLDNVDARFKNDPRLIRVVSEKDPNWKGRNANLFRGKAAQYVIETLHAEDEDILLYTDVKIRHKPNWISQCVYLMFSRKVEVVGGVMDALPEHEPNWAECRAKVSSKNTFAPLVFARTLVMWLWALWRIFLRAYHDGALVKRNPEFSEAGTFINAQNFGDSESLPITATFGIMIRAIKRVFEYFGKYFPDHFRDSYEDFMEAWWLVFTGATIFCTGAWQVFHKHRANLRAMILEFARSARGACQMFVDDPTCPFGIRRARQVALVIGAVIFGVIALVYSIVSGHATAIRFLFSLAAFAWIVLGLVNVRKAKKWYAFFFLPFTVGFMLIFAVNFVRKGLEGGGVATTNDWLQRVWIPPFFFPFLVMSYAGGNETECRETGFSGIALAY